MQLSQWVPFLCCHGADDAAQTVVDVSSQVSGEVTQVQSLCTSARTTGESFVTTSRDLGHDLGALMGKTNTNNNNKSALDASVFVKLRDLVQKNQTRQARDQLSGLMALAEQILQRAGNMEQSIQEGIESLPDFVQEEYNAKGDDAGKEQQQHQQQQQSRSLGMGDEVGDEAELEELLNVDADIAELENSCRTATRGGGTGLTLFSASTLGQAVFEGTTAKGVHCQTLLDKMRELCAAVSNVMQALAAENGMNCCVRMQALASGLAGLFRCRYLVNLLRRMAAAVLRLVKAIGDLIQLVWSRVQGFLGEFDAAKKLGRFAKNQIRNSKVGKLATGFASNQSWLPGCG